MERTEFTEFIPSLPQELGLECMTRLPYMAHRVASRVCKQWRELLESKDFYYRRKKLRYTHKVACLVQAVHGADVLQGSKPGSSPPSFGITVFDSVSQTWQRLDPVPMYPGGLPLFCQLASCDGKLVVMGGWDPVSYEQVSHVFVYDFPTRMWREGKEMPSKRSFFAIGAYSGRVYVAGGHDENKNALKTGWVYDLSEDEWAELSQMSQERDECEGVVIGDEFWVVSGYRTDNQGEFEESAEVYEFRPGQWRRVEEAWVPGRCPRSCVGAGKDGKLMRWADLDPEVRVAGRGIMFGSRVMFIGSENPGAPQGFYMVEMKDGQNGRLEKIDVPEEFCGFVQSGCCVEI
ncbi:F-BOX/KELCH-REPEAT PLANT-LIKE PROTEIN [Salix viminalis]|uniref:F-BOX/KELCH-REPEAT PLANT-LIKE PROTEIN n=1 Tax=Salix viminalis TaxID=40686 RepID=A0A9Q0TLZ9_SALVM|nr:F-BOX/KELCH-REPEAT PLANT-LIKE PROTEIN [Salix viminalis]